MRHCRYCGGRGHNIRSCSTLREQASKDPNSWAARKVASIATKNKVNSSSTRKCSYCKDSGHNRASCSKLSTDYVEMVKVNAEYRKNMLSKMRMAGFGIGALIEQKYSEENNLQLITEIVWDNINCDSVRSGWSNQIAFDGEYPCHRIDVNKFSENKYEDYYMRILEPASEESVVSSIPDGWLSGKSPKIDEYFGRKPR